jgi:hypothetical protein
MRYSYIYIDIVDEILCHTSDIKYNEIIHIYIDIIDEIL